MHGLKRSVVDLPPSVQEAATVIAAAEARDPGRGMIMDLTDGAEVEWTAGGGSPSRT
jgi:hypothetical protein